MNHSNETGKGVLPTTKTTKSKDAQFYSEQTFVPKQPAAKIIISHKCQQHQQQKTGTIFCMDKLYAPTNKYTHDKELFYVGRPLLHPR